LTDLPADDDSERSAPAPAAASAYVRLRELIVRGRLAPGVRLVEAAIADWLGVSRTPVREAMQQLRRDRLLVRIDGGTGARARLVVAPLGRAQMEELYRLAGALEGVAARSLAGMTPRRRTQIVRGLERTEKAFKAEEAKAAADFDTLFEIHQSFHRQFFDPGAGPETRALLGSIEPQINRYEWFYAPLVGPDFQATHVEHGAIIDAINEASADSIEAAVRLNWINSASRLAPLIERHDFDLPQVSIVNLDRRSFSY
jgi:DNA-binding GntR family transcriptional regulator